MRHIWRVTLYQCKHFLASSRSVGSLTYCKRNVCVINKVFLWGTRGTACFCCCRPGRSLKNTPVNCKIAVVVAYEPFHATLHHLCARCTIRYYAEPFHAALHHLCVHCTIRLYAEPFHATLHCLYVRCTILHYAELFHATLHHLCVRCATRSYSVPFDATLHRLCTVLQMSAKLFVIEPVHLTISCSNSTLATRPFIIWLNYPCLGCSVSRRKTKPSIIWPCHSFISYSILQLIFRPALYLLIYLTSLYFWWWRPPIDGTVWVANCERCRVELLADFSKLQLYFNNGKKGKVDRNLFGTNCYCSGLISFGGQFEITIE